MISYDMMCVIMTQVIYLKCYLVSPLHVATGNRNKDTCLCLLQTKQQKVEVDSSPSIEISSKSTVRYIYYPFRIHKAIKPFSFCHTGSPQAVYRALNDLYGLWTR